jgi:hypothetical protein
MQQHARNNRERQRAADGPRRRHRWGASCFPILQNVGSAKVERGGFTQRLLAVNVGLPQNIQWRGETVYTGIWKNPVGGRRVVRRGNLEGDGQGDLSGHGGEHRAVMIYLILAPSPSP